mgnify:CR=1 FL=1
MVNFRRGTFFVEHRRSSEFRKFVDFIFSMEKYSLLKVVESDFSHIGLFPLVYLLPDNLILVKFTKHNVIY